MDDEPTQEIDIPNEFMTDLEDEPEEIEDLLELVYNKKTDTWEQVGEFDLPSDFDVFYDWFMDEISDDISTTSSMKEEGDEVVFNLPEDLYSTYLDEIEKGIDDDPIKDELDNIAQDENFDINEIEDDRFDVE